MGMSKIKKEELVWKIIRDAYDDYYLVEASLPIGTSKFENTNLMSATKDKIRVSRATINHITKIKTLATIGYSLYGDLPKRITILESEVKDEVRHMPAAGGAECITYKVGKLLRPNGFDRSHCQCTNGLHFFRAKDFPKKVTWK